MITLHDIQSAQSRIRNYIRRTPLVSCRTLSELLQTNVYLKLELFQTTGAFKVRGAFNKMLNDLDEARRSGVVAVSGGNHAQAVAYAGKVLNCRAVIVMMESTPKNYLNATRGYGAEVVLTANINEAFERAHEYKRKGMMFVHPF